MEALGIANRLGEQTTGTIDGSPETIHLRARKTERIRGFEESFLTAGEQ